MADKRILWNEKLVGANHATLADTLNRLALVEHNSDGTHNLPGIITPEYYTANTVPGTTDMTSAIQSALNAGKGRLWLGPQRYRVTARIVYTGAISVVGLGASPGSGISTITPTLPPVSTIDHDFDGDLFYITGTDNDVNAGAGFSLGNLLIRQVYGDGSADAGCAIKIYATDATFQPSWIRMRNLNIEVKPGCNDWEYPLVVDGEATTGIWDVWLDNSRFTTGTYSTGGILLKFVNNFFMNGTMLNASAGAKNNLVVTGSAGKLSANIHVVNSTGNSLDLDFAQGVRVAGGGWTVITMTANTVYCQLHPNYIGTAPTMAGTDNWLSGYNAGTGHYILYTSSGRYVVLNGFMQGTALNATTGDITATAGDLVTITANKGIRVRTPDNTKTYRISVDNAGAVTTTLVP